MKLFNHFKKKIIFSHSLHILLINIFAILFLSISLYLYQYRFPPQKPFQDNLFRIFQYIIFYIQIMFSVPNIKFKTEYCLFWKQGKACEKGKGCFFAHGEEELRTIQQNHKEILSQNSQGLVSQGKPKNYKTIYCKFYSEGNCKLGNKCTYAHQRKQKRKKSYNQQHKIEEPTDPNIYWQTLQYYQYYNQMYYGQLVESLNRVTLDEKNESLIEGEKDKLQSQKQNKNQLNCDNYSVTQNHPINNNQKSQIKCTTEIKQVDQSKND